MQERKEKSKETDDIELNADFCCSKRCIII